MRGRLVRLHGLVTYNNHYRGFRFTRLFTLLTRAAAGFFFFGCLTIRRDVIGSSSVTAGTTFGSDFLRSGMARKPTRNGDILTPPWPI